jgi:phosphoglycerate dehydrogenase-like enzyme
MAGGGRLSIDAMTILAISGLIRPLLEPRLPDDVEVRWFLTHDEALEAVKGAEIGWFDSNNKDDMIASLMAATELKWLNSIYAGLDFLPMDVLIERGITVTNGAGINAITIAEYVVMGMLNIAKGYREVVRAQDRHEWLFDSPGKRELAGSKALLLGYGAIGKLMMWFILALYITFYRQSSDGNIVLIAPQCLFARVQFTTGIIGFSGNNDMQI